MAVVNLADLGGLGDFGELRGDRVLREYHFLLTIPGLVK